MKVAMEFDSPVVPDALEVGNVYHVRGGRGLRDGHMNIVIAITEPKDRYGMQGRMALCLTVDKEGDPRGVTSYAVHYFEDKMPVAFCDGVADINLVVRSL